MAQCASCGYWLGHQTGCPGGNLIVFSNDSQLYRSYESDKWFDRYVACVKQRDEIDTRLVSLQCRVETLFDAIKDGLSPEFHPWLKAKIEEHFK